LPSTKPTANIRAPTISNPPSTTASSSTPEIASTHEIAYSTHEIARAADRQERRRRAW